MTRRAFAVQVARLVCKAFGWKSSWSEYLVADEVMLALRAEERAGRLVWKDGGYYEQ